MLQAEIAELIDPTLLWELCFYYDERDGIGQKFVRYTVFTENEILPRLKEDPRVFYTEDRKRLAPAFESHMDRLQEWRRDVRRSTSGRAVSMTGCASHRKRDRPAGPPSEGRSTSAGSRDDDETRGGFIAPRPGHLESASNRSIDSTTSRSA